MNPSLTPFSQAGGLSLAPARLQFPTLKARLSADSVNGFNFPVTQAQNLSATSYNDFCGNR